MTETQKHNIVVIGAGIIAYYITRHPKFSLNTHTLTVLEASSPAAGASGKAGGLLSRDWHRGPTKTLGKLSFNEHARLAEEHNGQDKWEYRRLNVYSVEASSSPTTARQRFVQKELYWLDQPTLTVEESSKIGTVDDMAQVHPFKFTTSILSLAQESGAEFIQGLCTKINDTSITYTSEDKSSATLSADTVIVTTGPWTPKLLPSIPISTSRAHSIVIEPPTQLPAQAIFFSYSSSSHTMEPELYSRPSSVYICGPTDSTHALPDYARDVEILEKATGTLERFASSISTRLAENIVTRQACYLPFHERGYPAIGWLSKRVYLAAGHGVWGISLAPGTGKIVAEMVLSGSNGRIGGIDMSKLAP